MVVVVVVVVVTVCPVAGLLWVSLLMVGDVYDVGPPGASSVGLDTDVGLVDGKPFVLLEASDGASVVSELAASLLRPGDDSAVSLS